MSRRASKFNQPRGTTACGVLICTNDGEARLSFGQSRFDVVHGSEQLFRGLVSEAVAFVQRAENLGCRRCGRLPHSPRFRALFYLVGSRDVRFRLWVFFAEASVRSCGRGAVLPTVHAWQVFPPTQVASTVRHLTVVEGSGKCADATVAN